MKRFTIIFFISGIGFFLLPFLFFASAQSPCPAGYGSLCFNLTENPNIIGNIIQLLIIVAIILSVIFLIIGGIRWIMSGGDKGKVEQARSMVTAAIVGLVVSLVGYFIVNMVLYLLGSNVSLNNIKIPRLID